MRFEWFLVPACLLSAGSPPAAAPRAAIVCAIEGQARLDGRRALALHDWIAPGARIQTGAGARLVLVFASGDRFEMEGGSRAKVGAKGLLAEQGRIEKKDRLPMIPSMARTTVAAAKGKPGGVTVRAPGLKKPWYSGFQPGEGSSVLADTTVLSVKVLEPGGRFRTQVLDAAGRLIYSGEDDPERLPLAAGLLKPGAWYTWQVSPLDPERGRPLVARFWTVEAGHAEVRARLQAAAGTSGDAATLLEAMDRWLGLGR